MKRILLITLATGLCVYIPARDKSVQGLRSDASKKIEKNPADTIPQTWKKGGLITLNIAEGALDNWVGGGDKFSFSAVSFFNLYAFYKKGKHAWDNNLDLGYGIVTTTSLGQRKSDDRIDMLSKYGYAIGPRWSAGALFNFRTQFSKGYTYNKDILGREIKTLTSASFAPAYILFGLGFDYKPDKYFSLFISPLTERWIIVSNDTLSLKGAYGVKPGKKVRNELGAFISANFNKEVGKNIIYTSRLDIFSNYKHEPGNVDVFWTNVLAMKVNKIISANINLDLLYDDDAIARLQTRQLLAVGLSARF